MLVLNSSWTSSGLKSRELITWTQNMWIKSLHAELKTKQNSNFKTRQNNRKSNFPHLRFWLRESMIYTLLFLLMFINFPTQWCGGNIQTRFCWVSERGNKLKNDSFQTGILKLQKPGMSVTSLHKIWCNCINLSICELFLSFFFHPSVPFQSVSYIFLRPLTYNKMYWWTWEGCFVSLHL